VLERLLERFPHRNCGPLLPHVDVARIMIDIVAPYCRHSARKFKEIGNFEQGIVLQLVAP
jgi:hypothetical protein